MRRCERILAENPYSYKKSIGLLFNIVIIKLFISITLRKKFIDNFCNFTLYIAF